ncbi:G protein-regulated inducer of neurite outgrowth 2 [Rhinophrynus dorsalis]
MASSNHRLSTHSCQETLNLNCHGKPVQGCHSLSKSVSTLSDGQEQIQRRHGLYKSLNSVHCLSKCNENSILNSHSSEWPPAQDGDLDSYSVQSNCNHLVIDHAVKTQLQNHYLSTDSSLAHKEQENQMTFVRSNVSENISLLGHSEMSVYKAQSVDRLDTPGMGVQKSYSDFFCGNKASVSSPLMILNKSNATYSAICSSSSISDLGSDGTRNVTHDSGIVHSPSNNQNNLTEVICSAQDQNASLCHLDSSAIQQNITVYSVPGTYQHGILGPRNSGKGFPNNGYMHSQPHYHIPGVMSCDNISETKHYPPAMIIHNSCTLHCCTDHASMLKVDDTVAAYCHSLPIPSVKFPPGPIYSRSEAVSGQTPPQFCSLLPLPGKIHFPKLVSSVSESGLDAKKLMRCGRLIFPKSQMSIGELPLKKSIHDNHELLIKTSDTFPESTDVSAKMKDTWTMTSMNHLPVDCRVPFDCKDAEVQTVVIMENKCVSTSPCSQPGDHCYLLAETGLGLNLQYPKSPVREVRWDEEGMTWEVYGAAEDPEVLGLAIQKHLEIQIEQNLQPSELSREPGENTVEQSTKEKRRSFRTVMQSLRQSNCCVRTNSAE